MSPKEYRDLFIFGSIIWVLTVLIGIATLDRWTPKEQTIGSALAERRILQVRP